MMHEKLIIVVRNSYTAQLIDAVTINVSREFYIEMHPKYLSQNAIICSAIKSLRATHTHAHIRTEQ